MNNEYLTKQFQFISFAKPFKVTKKMRDEMHVSPHKISIKKQSPDAPKLKDDAQKLSPPSTRHKLPLTITIKNYKCPSFNKLYSQRHWIFRKQMADEIHELVAFSEDVRKLPDNFVFNRPVDIIVTAYSKRPLDCSNVPIKVFEDGLKLAGIIKDDTIEYVKSVMAKSIKSEDEKVIIEII